CRVCAVKNSFGCDRIGGMRGRLPKPTSLKIIEGTARRDRINENEPVPPEGDVSCPERVQGRARGFWDEHAPVLEAMGLLTVADVPMLAELCQTEAEYWNAVDDVAEHGLRLISYTEAGSVWRENPSVRIGSDAGKRLKSLMVEFGMSPSSRTRVKAAPKAKEKSALEKLRERRPS
ncbi:MAG: phage terminase small subunit P27 family, partial [Pirellulales bacterium]